MSLEFVLRERGFAMGVPGRVMTCDAKARNGTVCYCAVEPRCDSGLDDLDRFDDIGSLVRFVEGNGGYYRCWCTVFVDGRGPMCVAKGDFGTFDECACFHEDAVADVGDGAFDELFGRGRAGSVLNGDMSFEVRRINPDETRAYAEWAGEAGGLECTCTVVGFLTGGSGFAARVGDRGSDMFDEVERRGGQFGAAVSLRNDQGRGAYLQRDGFGDHGEAVSFIVGFVARAVEVGASAALAEAQR